MPCLLYDMRYILIRKYNVYSKANRKAKRFEEYI